MTIEIAFASIDARDDAYTGYNTVGVRDEHGQLFSTTRETAAFLEELEREYLTRLYSLQQEINSKYSLLLAEELFTNDWEQDWHQSEGNENFIPEYEAIKAAAELKFPGNLAEYYT